HIGRFNNPAPATQSLVFENAALTWQRSATSPEFGRVSFELTTNGTDWAQLAPVSHSAGGWQVTNLSLPTSYAIRARGFLTSGQYNSSSWSVLAALGEGRAVIVDPPLSQRVNSGAAAALRVLAAGTPPLTYQWRKNGHDIPGATDAAYLLPSSAPADAGSYSACVSNTFGTTMSRPVVLAVLRTNMPFAATQLPGPVGETNATLNGMAVPRGYPTTAWFEWGTDANYGRVTPTVEVGNGTRVVRLSAPIDGLAAGGVYHYRLVASNAFSVALGPDRLFSTGMSVATWGDYTQGYPVTPSGLTNLVAVASGHSHLLGLRNDGTVVAWHCGGGYLFPGQTDVPAGLSNVIAIAGGYGHTLALQQDGTVSSWGRYMLSSLPVTVPAGLSNVIAIAGGDSHSLALKSDGTVVAWGDNSSRQTSVPSSLSNVVAIAAGSTHSLALKADGQVVAWGLDFGTVTPPTSLSNVVAISAESWHHLALRADGTVVAWGNNDFGQLNVPAGLQGVAAIATGFRHSLALNTDGTLVAWGDLYYVTNLPPTLAQVVAISSGDYHSLALSPVNLAPRPFKLSATGYPNRDMAIAPRAWDPNGDGLTYRIASAPTNGTLYQYTAEGRGELISSPGTPVTDPLGRVIFSPLPDAFGVPLTTLSLLANDGTSDSPPGLVAVNIVPPPVIQASGWVQNINRGFAVSFAGLSNASYTVQASTDLTNWTWVGSASQTTPGQFYFLDSGATNRPQRFYRLRSP
ncbi:MAG TPA: hypothetical protein VNZ22_13870, partial [Bacillota bacterium]|nr:hypothetical protein [Bacillota bacterium]